MSNQLITLKDVAISFGGKPLFEQLAFTIAKGDRICLVGRNGSGKSTLLKLITNQLEVDDGIIFIHPGIRIGYLPQQFQTDGHETIYDFMLANRKTPKDESQYQADIILGPLNLRGDMLLDTLSGGQQRRAALAKALIDEPDILLLDEPTNHLDIGAIEWLENYIQQYQGGLVCISHDRAFLKNISNKTYWITHKTVKVHSKGYSDFDRWSEAELAREAATLNKLGKKLDRENHWLTFGVTARRKRNVQRLEQLHQLRHTIKSEWKKHHSSTGSITLPLLEAAQKSRMILEMEGVGHTFDELKIISSFTSRIMRGDKIGIIGPNGSGKTTFLKIITGDLKPNNGHIRRGVNHRKFYDELTYFDQNRSHLNPNKTLWETLCPDGGDHVHLGKRQKHVVAYLKDFMFDPKQAKTPVSTLSGGEANRLLLAKMLANPGSILILDEPTNDLDMETLDMLQEVLANYKGTLLLVSHDRDFIDRVVGKTIVFKGDGKVEECVGGYSDYLAQKKQDDQTTQKEKSSSTPKTDHVKKTNTKKLSFKHQHALKTLPKTIKELEEKIATLNTTLSDSNLYQDKPDQFYETAQELETQKQALLAAEEELLEIEILREESE